MPRKPATPESPPSEFTPSTLEELKAGRRMAIVLDSGRSVVIRSLTLDELAAEEGLPDDLFHIALLDGLPGGVVGKIAEQLEAGDPASLEQAAKLSRDNLALRDRLVLAAVVEPKLTLADVKDLDPFDRATIALFAQRRRTIDAAGRRVGAQALDTFRIFDQEHGCPPDCPACQATARRVFNLQ